MKGVRVMWMRLIAGLVILLVPHVAAAGDPLKDAMKTARLPEQVYRIEVNKILHRQASRTLGSLGLNNV